MKVATTKISGGALYAKVADRLKVFWEENPKGKITTTPIIQGEYIMFTTEIISDQSKDFSKRATGSALEKLDKNVKTFEKTESVSVGRALALLGYLASGEIASSEEMEEFESYKETKHFELLESIKSQLETINTREEMLSLYNAYKGKGADIEKLIIEKGKSLK